MENVLLNQLIIAPFDVADYLDTQEMIAAFLSLCLEDENPDVFLSGLASAVRAKGMTEVAKKSGLGRESLYKALSPGAHPRHETVRKIIAALDLKLTVAV